MQIAIKPTEFKVYLAIFGKKTDQPKAYSYIFPILLPLLGSSSLVLPCYGFNSIFCLFQLFLYFSRTLDYFSTHVAIEDNLG